MIAATGTATGQCACGACTVRAEGVTPELWACWCDTCRRWQGLVGLGLEVPADGFHAEGPVRLWASSDFAERAFCGTCAAPLWVRNTAPGQPYEPMAGLFPNAAGAHLDREAFADRAPAAIRFAGDHTRRDAADYAGPVTDNAPPAGEGEPRMRGGCACGAVRFRLDHARDDGGMCHCDTCRAWTGGVYCVTGTTADAITLEGTPALIRWRSSPGVERVSCAACGGKLWYEVVEGDATGGVPGEVEICLGTLDDMGGRALVAEGFVDCRPSGYAFEGDHRRRSRAECLGITP